MFTSELSPTQLLVLRKPQKAKLDVIMSIILQDLTIRQIIRLCLVNTFPNDRSRRTQKYFRFIRGEHFEGYEPKLYEADFLFHLKEKNYLQAKIITNIILKNYGMPSGFIIDKIRTPLKKEGYISAPPLISAFGLVKPTPKGNQIINDLNVYLSEKEQQVMNLIDGDKEQFILIMKELGSFIFFFKLDNPELFKDIISMVKRINRTKPMGAENDLTEFTEAINIDLSYFTE